MLRDPLARQLGVRRLEDQADGSVRLEMAFTPAALGRPGFLHGGAIGGLLAIACDEAVGKGARGFTSHIEFLRGAREEVMTVEATVQRRRTIATATAVAWQDDREKPVATMSRKYRLPVA